MILNRFRITLCRPYNYAYDLYILEALFENEKLGFRDIKNILDKKVNKKISFETFINHIKKLKEDDYIKLSIILKN